MSRARDEAGAAAVVVAMFFSAVFFGLAALTVDVARWYLEVQRVQKVADAAALAGVTWMPQDLAQATLAAQDIAARNGYPNTGSTTVVVAQGSKPSQLKVTVSSTIDNAFGAAFGMDTTTIVRHAIADYTGPQPMGSPCNTLGNEPAGGNATSGPVASQLYVPPGATCPRIPYFWMSMAGPNVYKTQGDEYSTRYCEGAESGCLAASPNKKNQEYETPTGQPLGSNGYFLMVRVLPAAVGSNVTIQLYDPAYVSTGSACASTPSGSFPTGATANNWNPWTTTDGLTRYATTTGDFCSGDNNNSSFRVGSEVHTITSFGLRGPADDHNPLSATPIENCTRQYPGYGSPTVNNLRSTTGTYRPEIAQVFHEWVTLCSFPATVAGDYYLQVRTNVPLQGAINDNASYKPGTAASSPMYSQVGNDPSVMSTGSNRFAVRTYGPPAGSVSVSAFGKMSIFANADTAAPIFNLVRVLPGAAGQSLVFKFFDVGDSATSSAGATLTVLRPTDATGSAIANCVGIGFKNQNYPTCSISGIKNTSGWNGQAETLVVPIPANYSCNYVSSGGCWFRVQMNFDAGGVTDATTWTASVSGDPVRLIE